MYSYFSHLLPDSTRPTKSRTRFVPSFINLHLRSVKRGRCIAVSLSRPQLPFRSTGSHTGQDTKLGGKHFSGNRRTLQKTRDDADRNLFAKTRFARLYAHPTDRPRRKRRRNQLWSHLHFRRPLHPFLPQRRREGETSSLPRVNSPFLRLPPAPSPSSSGGK